MFQEESAVEQTKDKEVCPDWSLVEWVTLLSPEPPCRGGSLFDPCMSPRFSMSSNLSLASTPIKIGK